MQSMSARDAKNSFGKLIDTARAEPVAIEKHGRTVAVVLSIESYEQLRHGRSAKLRTVAGKRRSGPRTGRRPASNTSKQVKES